MNAYISFGNSDDKLSQREWSAFVDDLRHEIASEHCQVHGEWFSYPAAPWQNGAFCIDAPIDSASLKRHLSAIAGRYKQDSIAYLEGATEFLGAGVQA